MQKRAAVLAGSSTSTLDQPRREQALDDAHRLDQPRALAVAERDEQR